MKNSIRKRLSFSSAAVLSAVVIAAVPASAKPKMESCEMCKMSHQSTPVKAKAARSWVQLKATLDQKQYSVGQPISVHLSAANTHSSGAYLKFSSGQRFDFSVYSLDQKGDEKESVYTWSANKMFTEALGSLWIKPGQSEEFDAAVGDEMGQLKPGTYQLVAHFTNSPKGIVASPVSFEIVDTGITVKTTTDKTSYKIGEPVKIDVAVANRRKSVNSLSFGSGMTFDVMIFDESETQLWNYGANLRFIRGPHQESWKAGETKTFSTVWNGEALRDEIAKAGPGRYRVQGVLQSTPNVYAAPVFIDIAE